MVQKLKLMHLMGAPKAGGAETFFVRLMVALSKRKDVEILPVVRKGSWAAARLASAGVGHQTAWFGGWWDVFSAFKIKHLALGFEPDVVMGWMNRGTSFVPVCPATPKGASQDKLSFAARRGWATVGRLGGYYKLKNYVGRVEYLVGNTQDICDYCVKGGWSAEKVACVGNFIPAPAVGWRKQRGAVREKFGIAADAYVMVVAGRLHHVKGVDVVIRALVDLPEHVMLLVAGEGPLREELEALAVELGVGHRVRWAGWVDDVSGVASAADVWVVPSRFEPLGNTVLDGWAHGLPVVATRTSGPLGLIGGRQHPPSPRLRRARAVGGRKKEIGLGVLVEFDDVAGVVGAVTGLMEAPKKASAMAAAGHGEYVEKYSEEVVVEQFLGYYRGLKGRVGYGR